MAAEMPAYFFLKTASRAAKPMRIATTTAAIMPYSILVLSTGIGTCGNSIGVGAGPTARWVSAHEVP